MRVPGDYAGRRVRYKICGAVTTVPTTPPGGAIRSARPRSSWTFRRALHTRLPRRLELLPDDRSDGLVPDCASSALLAELGRPAPVAWYELPQLAREAVEAGITLAVAPRRGV
jgi:hypothetical protein